jgi:hypothetical protein
MPDPPALPPKMKKVLDDFAADSRIQQNGPRILSTLRNSPLVGAEIETSRDAALAADDTNTTRKQLKTYLESLPFPHYEAHPKIEGLLIRIEEDGRRTVGGFVAREFLQIEAVESEAMVERIKRNMQPENLDEDRKNKDFIAFAKRIGEGARTRLKKDLAQREENEL